MEDHVIKTYEFPSGVYYWFEFEDETPTTLMKRRLLKACTKPKYFQPMCGIKAEAACVSHPAAILV